MGASFVAGPSSLCSFEEEEEDDVFEEDKNPINTFRSQLSKTLPEILSDKSALGYFIQYMDFRKEVSVIKFWLEVECLCGAYSTQESLNENRKTRELINSTNDSENVDNCACSISTSISDLELDALSLDSSVNNNEQSLVSLYSSILQII